MRQQAGQDHNSSQCDQGQRDEEVSPAPSRLRPAKREAMLRLPLGLAPVWREFFRSFLIFLDIVSWRFFIFFYYSKSTHPVTTKKLFFCSSGIPFHWATTNKEET